MKSKNVEVKMNVMVEIIDVAVVKNIFHILHFILILKQNMMEKLQKENALLKAKTEAIESERDKAETYKEVIAALSSYRSESEDDYPEDPYVY